jgi:glycosyltransferase involved in cell wall biosynthesis
MTHLSIVIPLYNESTLISELLKQVNLNATESTTDFEVIMVDDGSTDQTWNQILKLSEKQTNLKGIKLSRNFGHHYAITAGLRSSIGEWVVVMDGDLQDRPEVIPKLYKKAHEGFDIVFVSRRNRPEKFYYKILQKTFYWFLRILSGIKFDSTQANFSIINRKVVDAFNDFPESARFYGTTIKWLGFKTTQIQADHGMRFSGKPSYTFKKRIKLAGDIIIAFSERPLKFAVVVGLLISIFSVIGAVWIIYSAINWGYSVTGWTSLMFSTFFFSGILLIVLGIIGIYIGRIFQEVKRRPLYVISEKINF